METGIIDRGRGPEITGTRITVYDVMDYYLAGDSLSFIAYALSISTGQVEAAIRYIEENKGQVDREYQEMLSKEARGNPPEVEAKLARSRKKLQETLQKSQLTPLPESINAGNSGR